MLIWIKRQAVFVPTLGWNVLLGRVLRVRRWWDQVDDHVVLGALPFARDVPGLTSLGVGAVVNTCAEYAGPQAAYEAAGIEQLHVPTIDFTPPTLEDVRLSLELMERQAEAGRSTYVHCKAGRARSATIVMCWLMLRNGWTPEEAQQFLLSIRPHVNPRLAERAVVREFYAALCGQGEA